MEAGWWATSALESNIGLNAIAQWAADATAEEARPMPQGLGTGSLFTNNLPSPLVVGEGTLRLDRPEAQANGTLRTWDLSDLLG